MELFLSWSRDRSRALAQLLYQWLPEVIQQITPWMSSEDIEKGSRWSTIIGERLEAGKMGIICLTSENVNAPWLNFEAGALAKSLTEARVFPLLLDLKPSQITGPLTQFQVTVATDRDDMARLLSTLNSLCAPPLPSARLDKAFERAWPEFAERTTPILETESATALPIPPRDPAEMFGEILESVRDLQRSFRGLRGAQPAFSLIGLSPGDPFSVANVGNITDAMAVDLNAASEITFEQATSGAGADQAGVYGGMRIAVVFWMAGLAPMSSLASLLASRLDPVYDALLIISYAPSASSSFISMVKVDRRLVALVRWAPDGVGPSAIGEGLRMLVGDLPGTAP